MSEEFTPGPWEAERRQSQSVVLQTRGTVDGYSNRVAECPQWSPAAHPQPTPDQAWANARLIAAAPDLLEAGEAALTALIGVDRLLHEQGMMKGVTNPAIEPLRAAIAKARPS